MKEPFIPGLLLIVWELYWSQFSRVIGKSSYEDLLMAMKETSLITPGKKV
jgi:hypothetical protein